MLFKPKGRTIVTHGAGSLPQSIKDKLAKNKMNGCYIVDRDDICSDLVQMSFSDVTDAEVLRTLQDNSDERMESDE